MSLLVTHDFDPRWQSCWATTYSFDVVYFDQHLFGRLGDPPLSVNILADAEQLADTWNHANEVPWMLARANRDYLVRGVRLPRGRFHPKTYFFSNSKRGVLLVGSGNLGLHGLAQGHEVFCRFDSEHLSELSAILSWRSWMQRIIEERDEHLLAVRWQQLLAQTPWISNPSSVSPFLTNFDQSILDQFIAAIQGTVEELHVLAPFFDPGALALENILQRIRPHTLFLYSPAGMSVDGTKLRRMVEKSGLEVRVQRFEPDDFVHAKLFGVIQGDQGLLLSGSANCSQSALLATTVTGNAEAAIISTLSADQIRNAFVPDGCVALEASIDSLSSFVFRADTSVGIQRQVYLDSASLEPNFKVVLSYVTTLANDALRLESDTGWSTKLDGNRSTDPTPRDAVPRLVWLVDELGQTYSNRVPLDEPAQLQNWLGERRHSAEKPSELHFQDLGTPFGQLLQWLNSQCIFDIEETPVIQHLQRVGADQTDGSAEADYEFWDRIAGQELRTDPRSTRYSTFFAGTALHDFGNDDDVIRLLEVMLHRTPSESRPIHHLLDDDFDDSDPKRQHGWSPDARQRVRFSNVLRRWCRAIDDPRFRWLSPYAAARNYAALLTALAEARIRHYLTPDRIEELLRELLIHFFGTETHRGYLFSLSGEERIEVQDILRRWQTSAVCSALVFATLEPNGAWARVVFAWQPTLRVALNLGLIEAGEGTPELVQAMLGVKKPTDQVNYHLRRLETYLDDKRWCVLVEAELGFEKVSLIHQANNIRYPLLVEVIGSDDALQDSRLPVLARRARSYRKMAGFVLILPNRDRISVDRTGMAFAIIRGEEYESDELITEQGLRDLEQEAAPWASVLRISNKV